MVRFCLPLSIVVYSYSQVLYIITHSVMKPVYTILVIPDNYVNCAIERMLKKERIATPVITLI